jgi:hypothetical protein
MPKPIEKRLLDPARVRRTAASFSWLDRRFLRDGWIDRLARDEILLYLFLVAVSDQRGLSYYSDRSIAALLKVDQDRIATCRTRLLELTLIAFDPPLYQVLDLTPRPRCASTGEPRSIAALFQDIARSRSAATEKRS